MDLLVAAARGAKPTGAEGATAGLQQQQVGADARAADVRRHGPTRVAQLPAKQRRADAGAAGARTSQSLAVEADALLQLRRPAADVGDWNATMLRRAHLRRKAGEDEQLDKDLFHVVTELR